MVAEKIDFTDNPESILKIKKKNRTIKVEPLKKNTHKIEVTERPMLMSNLSVAQVQSTIPITVISRW